jgi:hypothetical protein
MVLTLRAIRWLCMAEPYPPGAVARPHDRNAASHEFPDPAPGCFGDAGQAAQCLH